VWAQVTCYEGWPGELVLRVKLPASGHRHRLHVTHDWCRTLAAREDCPPVERRALLSCVATAMMPALLDRLALVPFPPGGAGASGSTFSSTLVTAKVSGATLATPSTGCDSDSEREGSSDNEWVETCSESPIEVAVADTSESDTALAVPHSLMIRSTGKPGRIVLSTVLRLSGSTMLLRLHSLCPSLGDWLLVSVLDTETHASYQLALSSRERVELLGARAWSERDSWTKRLLQRLLCEVVISADTPRERNFKYPALDFMKVSLRCLTCASGVL
jgi:hypothetical protein